ncbi:MAG: MCE family protein [Bdellovibrionaceae bacterium]|nr:MCE family protein [Pseudobdellovibrionaceae bacterium]
MKVKFNKFERIAGLFVLFAIIGCMVMAVSVAIKQGWFENKIKFESIFTNADGVHSGTTVLIAGLRAGSVEEVELLGNNKIRVSYYVLGKFSERIREDSKAQLVRPFVIGDRVLELSVGSPEAKIAQEGVLIDSEETLDLMTLLSGKRLGTSLEKISDMLGNLQFLMEAFLDRDRTRSMLNLFDKLDPLMSNMNNMSEEVIKLSQQLTYKENLKKTISQTAILTKELNVILPELNRRNPQLAKNLAQLTGSLAQMTDDFKVLTNLMKDYGPHVPVVAKRALEALDEATVLMKAMQKNFFLRSSVKEVADEEAAEVDQGTRQPAREKGKKP